MCMCVCKQGPCCTLATSVAVKVAVQWRVVQDRVMVCTCVSLLGTPASEQGEGVIDVHASLSGCIMQTLSRMLTMI